MKQFIVGFLCGMLLVVFFSLTSPYDNTVRCVKAAQEGSYNLVWMAEANNDGGCLVKTIVNGNELLLSIKEYERMLK